MDSSLVRVFPGIEARLPDAKVVLAFAAIYVLWGATFLAIRVAVLEVPFLFASGLRFLIAGSALYTFMRLRGQPSPTPTQWRTIAVLALFMFVATYAALFWAEQYVPSGVASVIEATLPITTMVIEVFIFRRHALHWRMGAAVVLGFLGVACLLLRTDAAVPGLPCLVILAGGIAWSLGAVLTRQMPTPRSVALSAGAQMMLGGAVLLTLSGISGELSPFPEISVRAGVALLYLVVAGSLIGFTAYLWLLARMPATRVASHAYVNPLVALALGYFIGGETLTPRMLLASVLVIASVFLILTNPRGREGRSDNRRTSPWHRHSVLRSARRATRDAAASAGRSSAGVPGGARSGVALTRHKRESSIPAHRTAHNG